MAVIPAKAGIHFPTINPAGLVVEARGAAPGCRGTVHDATSEVTLRPKHPGVPSHPWGGAKPALGAQVVFNEWSGAAAPPLWQRRLGPSRRPTRSGTVLWPPHARFARPARGRRMPWAPLHLWVQVPLSRNRLKPAELARIFTSVIRTKDRSPTKFRRRGDLAGHACTGGWPSARKEQEAGSSPRCS